MGLQSNGKPTPRNDVEEMAIDMHSIVARDTALCKSIHILTPLQPSRMGSAAWKRQMVAATVATAASHRLGLASESESAKANLKKRKMRENTCVPVFEFQTDELDQSSNRMQDSRRRFGSRNV